MCYSADLTMVICFNKCAATPRKLCEKDGVMRVHSHEAIDMEPFLDFCLIEGLTLFLQPWLCYRLQDSRNRAGDIIHEVPWVPGTCSLELLTG